MTATCHTMQVTRLTNRAETSGRASAHNVARRPVPHASVPSGPSLPPHSNHQTTSPHTTNGLPCPPLFAPSPRPPRPTCFTSSRFASRRGDGAATTLPLPLPGAAANPVDVRLRTASPGSAPAAPVLRLAPPLLLRAGSTPLPTRAVAAPSPRRLGVWCWCGSGALLPLLAVMSHTWASGRLEPRGVPGSRSRPSLCGAGEG